MSAEQFLNGQILELREQRAALTAQLAERDRALRVIHDIAVYPTCGWEEARSTIATLSSPAEAPGPDPEAQIEKVIDEWKFHWMNKDDDGYRMAAQMVDANMMADLAARLARRTPK